MSSKQKNHLLTYFITLFILVGLASLAYAWALASTVEVLPLLILVLVYMPTPLFALLLTNAIQRTPINILQYGWISGLRPCAIAWVVSIFLSWIGLFIGVTAGLSALVPSTGASVAGSIDDVRSNIADTFGSEMAASANLPDSLPALLIVGILAAIISGFTINLVVALGEEYGWRGYLRKALPGSIWRKHTIIGLVWGAWHLPLIWLGYNYDRPMDVIPLLVFMLFAVMMGYVFAYIVERFDNVMYAGIFHGMFNGFAGMFAFLLSSHNPLISGPVGIISALCFLAIAIVLFGFWPISAATPTSQPQPPRQR